MKKIVAIALLCSTLGACTEETGFSLPKGNVENGALLFDQYQCQQCHIFTDTEFVGDEWRLTENDGIAVELGGAKENKQTYADLVTSIINPSHRIAEGYVLDNVTYPDGESQMPYYNSVMTIEELTDIVTFLETKYFVIEKPVTMYPPYAYSAPL